MAQRELYAGCVVACLEGVLQQIDQRLLDLPGVEIAIHARGVTQLQRGVQHANAFQERRPRHAFQARLGQAREPRVALEKSRQVRSALFDDVEHALELGQLFRIFRDQARRVHHRRDRREGVVQLVIDQPNHLLPDLDFLTAELRGQVLHHQQRVRLVLECEVALGQVIRARFAVLLHGEEGIGLGEQALAQRFRRAIEQAQEILAGQRAALEKELARLRVRIREPSRIAVQHDGHGRVFDHGLQQ